jgi:hypothetical protein
MRAKLEKRAAELEEEKRQKNEQRSNHKTKSSRGRNSKNDNAEKEVDAENQKVSFYLLHNIPYQNYLHKYKQFFLFLSQYRLQAFQAQHL